MPDPAPLPPSLQRRADQLAATLAAGNRRVYRAALAQHAAAFGKKAPRHVQSAAVKDAIAQRAAVSASSLTRTHLAARQRFYEQTGSVPEAKVLYKQWVEERARAVAAFEAGMAASAAAADFRTRNADVLSGVARVVPPDTDSSDICRDFIAMGEIPIAEVEDVLPAHMHCPHAWEQTYDDLGDVSSLWVGGPDDD
jgi:hypothetical protein